MQKKRLLIMGIVLALVVTMVQTTIFAEELVFWDVPKDAWEAPYVYELVERGIVNGYEDGAFGPTTPVQRCEYAKMLVGISDTPVSTSITTPFVDVPDWQWYFSYVNSATPYMTGFTRDGQLYFDPEAYATREDITVALIKALGIDASPYMNQDGYLETYFNDVHTISVHNRPYIAAALDRGYITGDVGGTFRGQDTIIRAEVVAVLCRAFPK